MKRIRRTIFCSSIGVMRRDKELSNCVQTAMKSAGYDFACTAQWDRHSPGVVLVVTFTPDARTPCLIGQVVSKSLCEQIAAAFSIVAIELFNPFAREGSGHQWIRTYGAAKAKDNATDQDPWGDGTRPWYLDATDSETGGEVVA